MRLAFEGSAGPAGSASTYLQDAVDLQIRVLDLPRIPRREPLDGLLTGARRTVVVVVHSDADSVFDGSKTLLLVVDLRTETHHDSALLPFDAAPVVHVHDGNVIRVVFHALGCHLRMLRAKSLAVNDDVILPHKPTKPTTYSLRSACESLRPRDPRKTARIAYPNPPLPVQYTDSVRPILQARQPEVALVTHDDIGSPVATS